MAKMKKMMNGAEKVSRRPGNEARTKARKDKRRVAQFEREVANNFRRLMHEATPWEVAKARRAAIRQGVQLAS